MLQQTQVSTVIPYFERFMARFPNVASLAAADEQDVLALWSGLGYYARGRNILRAARIIQHEFGGEFPSELEQLMSLPGIGRSTAGAICVFAFGSNHPILDGNVKRVVTRVYGIEGYPGDRAVEERLWPIVQSVTPSVDVETFTQGVMDLGATVCLRSRPNCDVCPLLARCVARRDARTGELPTPKPRKALPHRRTHMLLFWDGQEVFLQRRPAPGIWGGLMCFPEVIDADRVADYAMHDLGVADAEISPLPIIEHAFTHYRLTINPLLIKIKRRPEAMREPDSQWMNIEDAMKTALPSPIRVLLESLRMATNSAAGNPVSDR